MLAESRSIYIVNFIY